MPPMRRQSAANLPSLAPHGVGRGCSMNRHAEGSWRSHVHRTYTAQRVQSFKLQTRNVNFLWVGVREGYLFFKKRYPSLTPTQRKFTLWGCSSKDCTRCAVEVRCTWLRHGSSVSRYRQQPRPTPWGASDGSPAADCGAGGGIAALAAEKAKSHQSTSAAFR